MPLILKAFICLLTLIMSGCRFNVVQTETPPIATVEAMQPAQVAFPLSQQETAATAAQDHLKQEAAGLEEHDDIWALIRDNLELERELDRRGVQARIKWLTKNQQYIDRVVERAEPYLFHITARLKARAMPLDLALLPIVESAYQPFAYSRSHASGIWQFIASTGKHYGLQHNWWYDGRRDIVAATDAALDYLAVLHKRFNGDWQHALAAYNAGEGKVERAIRRNKKAGKETDFWSLRLPRETRGYLPGLLALAEVLHNKKHKIRFNPIPNQPYFESIDAGAQIDLATVAKLSGLTIAEVYTLNPGFNRWATAPNGPHRLLIPVTKAAQFKQGLAALPASERLSWKKHTIREGESLNRIAARHQTSVSVLKQTNRLSGDLIRAGHALLIPVAKQPGAYYSLSADVRRFGNLKKTGDGRRYIYTIKRGDNLWNISRHYGISVRQLTAWNGIYKTSILRPGQKLTVWVKDETRKPQRQKLIKAVAKKTNNDLYTVRRGDSLWLIARKFNIRVKDLLAWNNLRQGRHLQPGQNLIVKSGLTGI